MKQEEMIKNKAKEYAYKNYEQGGDSDTWEGIYTDGAGYGYQLAVNKACEWLDHNRPIGTGDPEWEDTIEDLKKAMEGCKDGIQQ